MKPEGGQGAGNGKFCEAADEGSSRCDLRAVEKDAEEKAHNRVGQCEAGEKGRRLGRDKEADHVAGDSYGHSHKGAAVEGRCRQGQEGKAEFQNLGKPDIKEGQYDIKGYEKSAKADALYAVDAFQLFLEVECVFGT